MPSGQLTAVMQGEVGGFLHIYLFPFFFLIKKTTVTDGAPCFWTLALF